MIEEPYADAVRRDEQYMNALRALPRPAGVNDLERFALDYRRLVCWRYNHFVELFASIGLTI